MKKIKAFPNPSTDKVKVVFESSEEHEMVLLNNVGMTVFVDNEFKSGDTIDLTGYPAGIYLVRIASGSTVKTLKIQKSF